MSAHPPQPTPLSTPSLNAEQRLVVEHTTGPLLVLAGAGSGKTRAITERTAHLVDEGLARPGEILQITFTNKGAQEMRERLARRLGARMASGVQLGTFHALCLRILRAHPGDSGRTQRFSIYDEADQRRVVDRYLSRADRGRMDRDAVCRAISRAKSHLLDAEGFTAAGPEQLGGLALTDDETAIVAAVWRAVDAELERSDALDFDDLLAFAVRLLERHEPIAAAWRERYRFIGVDEYQDTNPSSTGCCGCSPASGATSSSSPTTTSRSTASAAPRSATSCASKTTCRRASCGSCATTARRRRSSRRPTA